MFISYTVDAVAHFPCFNTHTLLWPKLITGADRRGFSNYEWDLIG